MRALRPLIRLLQRSLRAALFRRSLAWLACALLLIVLGNPLSLLFEHGRVIRLGILMAALSALPAFLFWPLPERFLLDRLRRLDEETVFEAFLEAEPGPVRDILRRLAAERAAVLPLLQPLREPLGRGLGGLWATAVACLLLVEGGSFLVLGRSLTLAPESPAQAEEGKRIEDAGFSDFATEDPSARRTRRERTQEQDRERGENPTLGSAEESSGRAGFSPSAGADLSASGNGQDRDAVAKRRQGEREDALGGESAPSGPGGSPGADDRRAPGAEGRREEAGMTPQPGTEPASAGMPTVPGRTGQGYEHTGDTKVPSPLLDYRSRFETRYSERTGGHLAASGRMGFGELRDFQRRYFESFTLKADVGLADDPYAAQLKRRWNELKGGFR